jgi:hypothetical protein
MAINPYVMQSGAGASVGWNGTSVGTTSTNSLIRAFEQNGTAVLAPGDVAYFDTDSVHTYDSPFAFVTNGVYSGNSYYINRNSTAGASAWLNISTSGRIKWGDFKGYDHWPFDNRGRLEVITNNPNTNIDVNIRLWSDYIFVISNIGYTPPPAQQWPSTGGIDYYGSIAAGGTGTSQSTSGANGAIRYYWSIVNQDMVWPFNVDLDISDHHTGHQIYAGNQFIDSATNSPNNVWESNTAADFWRCPVFKITVN